MRETKRGREGGLKGVVSWDGVGLGVGWLFAGNAPLRPFIFMCWRREGWSLSLASRC